MHSRPPRKTASIRFYGWSLYIDCAALNCRKDVDELTRTLMTVLSNLGVPGRLRMTSSASVVAASALRALCWESNFLKPVIAACRRSISVNGIIQPRDDGLICYPLSCPKLKCCRPFYRTCNLSHCGAPPPVKNTNLEHFFHPFLKFLHGVKTPKFGLDFRPSHFGSSTFRNAVNI